MGSLEPDKYKAKVTELLKAIEAKDGIEIDSDKKKNFLTEEKAKSRVAEFKKKLTGSDSKVSVKFSELSGEYDPIFDAIKNADLRTLTGLISKDNLQKKVKLDATVDDKSSFANVASVKPSGPQIKSTNIVVVGAGPVGLYLVLKLILSKVGFSKLTVFEKRSEDIVFSRQQELYIQNSVFNDFPDEIKKDLLASPNACKMFKPPTLLKSYCFTKTMKDDESNGYSIKINTLQKAFYDFIIAKKGSLNIEFLFDSDITSIEKTKVKYANEYGSVMEEPFDTLVLSSGNPKTVLESSNIGMQVKPISDVPELYGLAASITIDDSIKDRFPVQKEKPSRNQLQNFRNTQGFP